MKTPPKFRAGNMVMVPVRVSLGRDGYGAEMWGGTRPQRGKVLKRHDGVIDDTDKGWKLAPEVRQTRDQLGNYLVQCDGVVVLAHENELELAGA